MEQFPEDWTNAVASAATALLRGWTGPEVAAITLSGQMQDVVPVAKGAALRPALLYSDVRAQVVLQSTHNSENTHQS